MFSSNNRDYNYLVKFHNEVAIITGASSGIGLATARLLTRLGTKVVLAARSQEKLRQVSRGLSGSLVVPTDVTKERDVKDLVRRSKEHFGRIDILINNAGQGYDSSVEKIDLKTYRRLFELDVLGPLIAMKEVIPIMRSQKKGSIINISSGAAIMFLTGASPYTSLKWALITLSRAAREELANDHINVSLVYPYVTLTNFERNTIKAGVSRGEPAGWISQLPHPPDTAEYAAKKILEAIRRGKAEVFAHDWMQPIR
ncbi:MAG: SDR family oxidoreductase [Deltaproteobacteria bacterium]|nr:SDR family oxidoreductase [Deltaproteobacteria bacterium]